MTKYEELIINAIKEDKKDYTIFSRIFVAFNIDYFSPTDTILIQKDINYFRERINKGMSTPTGFMRWKTS